MSLPRLIGGFLVRLSVLYAAFMLVYPWIGNANASYARALGNLLFRSFVRDTFVKFEPHGAGDPKLDTDIVLRQRGGKWASRLPTNTQRICYIPTAVLFSLILATPVPWRRRGRALAWALLISQAFVALRMALLIVRFGIDSPLRIYRPSPFWESMFKSFVELVVWLPEGMYLIPAILWIALTVRPIDIRTVLSAEAGPRAHGAKRTPTN